MELGHEAVLTRNTSEYAANEENVDGIEGSSARQHASSIEIRGYLLYEMVQAGLRSPPKSEMVADALLEAHASTHI